MAIFSSTSPPASPESGKRTPTAKRVPATSAARLSTIVEGQAKNRSSADRPPPVTPPPLPSRSPWRALAYTASPRSPWSSTASSIRTAPPSYDWVSEPAEQPRDPRQPDDGEKLAALRRGDILQHRGGLKRLGLIILAILLVIIALAVGLGVGLTVGRRRSNPEPINVPTYGGPGDSNTTRAFPLGEYSMITALRTVSTSCASNPSTWRCYPYATYDAADTSSLARSTAIFNWIITNTSSIYASNATNLNLSTPENGIPANLTISSTNNPFSIMFSNHTLTYHATSGNTSAAYYSFSFSTSKTVIPSAPLTTDGSTSQCFFNQTVISARLYLSASANLFSANSTSMAGAGYTPWPFAVEVMEASPSGNDVPACYTTANNVVGTRITTGLDPVASAAECSCAYRNY